MPKVERDNALAIAAAVLVLFSAMLNPVLTVVLAALLLLFALIARFLAR
jgi:hypothetical protein